MAEFVALYLPATGGVQHAPVELVDHWAEYGWVPVPDDVNLADPDQVAALAAAPAKQPPSSTKQHTRTDKTED